MTALATGPRELSAEAYCQLEIPLGLAGMGRTVSFFNAAFSAVHAHNRKVETHGTGFVAIGLPGWDPNVSGIKKMGFAVSFVGTEAAIGHVLSDERIRLVAPDAGSAFIDEYETRDDGWVFRRHRGQSNKTLSALRSRIRRANASGHDTQVLKRVLSDLETGKPMNTSAPRKGDAYVDMQKHPLFLSVSDGKGAEKPVVSTYGLSVRDGDGSQLPGLVFPKLEVLTWSYREALYRSIFDDEAA